MCDEWAKSFDNFLRDMGPDEGRTLERKDNNKGYDKENCTWATVTEQANNRVSSLRVDYEGKAYTTKELACRFGLPEERLIQRLQALWTVEDAVSLSAYQSPTLRLEVSALYKLYGEIK